MLKFAAYICMCITLLHGSLSAQETNPLVDQSFVERASLEAFRAVIDGGADVNARGEKGRNPLQYAVRWSSLEAVKLLLEAGADPNLTNDGLNTALHWAATSWGDIDKVRLLLDNGANVNAQTQDGGTPLTMAVGYGGTFETVQLLIASGADPTFVTLELLELTTDARVLELFGQGAVANAPSSSTTVQSSAFQAGIVMPSGTSEEQVRISCSGASDAASFAECLIFAYRLAVYEKATLDRSFMDQIVADLQYRYPRFKCEQGLENVRPFIADLKEIQAEPDWAPEDCAEVASVFNMVTGMKAAYASCPADAEYSYSVFEACIDIFSILDYEKTLFDTFVRITGSTDQVVSWQFSDGMTGWAGRWNTPYGLAEDLKLSVSACLSEWGLDGLKQYEYIRPAFAGARVGAVSGNTESLFEEQRLLPTCAHIAQFLSDRGIVRKEDVEPLLEMQDSSGNFDKCNSMRPSQSPLVTEVKETTRLLASAVVCNENSFPVDFQTSLGSVIGGVQEGEPGTCLTMSMGMPTNVIYLGFRAASCMNTGSADASCQGFIEMSCDSTEMMACPTTTMEMSAQASYRYNPSNCAWEAYSLQVDPSTFAPSK